VWAQNNSLNEGVTQQQWPSAILHSYPRGGDHFVSQSETSCLRQKRGTNVVYRVSVQVNQNKKSPFYGNIESPKAVQIEYLILRSILPYNSKGPSIMHNPYIAYYIAAMSIQNDYRKPKIVKRPSLNATTNQGAS
jgi:hypothetical protein